MKKIAALLLALSMTSALLAQGRVVEEVVARVNDQVLTRTDYLQRKQATIEGVRQVFQGEDLARQLREVDANLLNIMIDEMLLIERAKQVFDIEKVVDYQVEQFMKENNISSEEQLRGALDSQGMTMEEFRKQLLQVVIPEFVKSREIRNKIVINNSEVEDFYNSNPELFETPGSVTLREIVILKEQADADHAGMVHNEVSERFKNGDDFAVLAEEFSQSYSKVNGGLVGTFAKGEMVGTTEEIVYATEVGQLTPLIETDAGWYMYLIAEKVDAGTVSLEDSRQRIVRYLQENQFKDTLEAYMVDLRKQNTIVINPKYQS